MPWFKVDDAFHSHPKVMGLSPAAVGVWTLAGAWSANYLTDGEVQANIIRRFGGTSEMIQELCTSGLWIDNHDGTYQFKDWDDYQPVKADVEAEREAARERMRQVRAKKKGVQHSEDVRANTTGTTDEVRITPTQSRPDPTLPQESAPPPPSATVGNSTDTPTPTTSNGSRLPEGWNPDPHVIQAMRDEHPDIDLEAEHAKFTDHWTSAPGAKGRKADWNATWRNWIRRSAEYRTSTPAGYTNATDRKRAVAADRAQRFAAQRATTGNPSPLQIIQGERQP